MKTVEEIVATINRYKLRDTFNLHGELMAKIRRDFTIIEIKILAEYLRGEDDGPLSEEWRRDRSGEINLPGIKSDRIPCYLDGMIRDAFFYLGAASLLKIKGANYDAGGWKLYEQKIDALVRDIPPEYRKQLDMASRLDQIKAQGDLIEKTATETRQGVGVLVSKLPDAKKPTVISWAEATEIFMPGVFIKRGDHFVRTDKERKTAVDSFRRNCSNWIKAGVAGKSKLPIAWDNLVTANTWEEWVKSYIIAERKAGVVSEAAGKTENERLNRTSPTRTPRPLA